MDKKYIDNEEKNGLIYDFNRIRKEFNKLKIPAQYYNPLCMPLEKCKYFVDLSERSTGKTTNLILLGMIFNKLYGTEIQYIRQKEDMIAPKSSRDLFTVILENNYIEKITEGKYNSVILKSRRWYYSKIDSEGNIIDQAQTHFMFMCTLEKAENLKSSYNAPFGDFIIFDEFIGKYYYPNEFVIFCDLVKTIIRDRQSPLIFLLANTINKHSTYFNELGIYDTIQFMNWGDKEIITTEKGTSIYIELIGTKKDTVKKKVNRLFFGFNNPSLASITGGDWAIDNYPHVLTDCVKTNTLNYSYIFHNNKIVQMEVKQIAGIGTVCELHWSKKIREGERVYCISNIEKPNYLYKLGFSKFDKFIWNLYKKNKFYYSTNDVGDFVKNYINECMKL